MHRLSYLEAALDDAKEADLSLQEGILMSQTKTGFGGPRM